MMDRHWIFCFLIVSLYADSILPGYRNVYQWPFRRQSIWNTPIGDSAVYEYANIPATQKVYTDEDIIVLAPRAPLTPVYYSDAGWDKSKDRCVVSDWSRVLQRVPMPADLIVPNGKPGTPNSGIVFLNSDMRTISQNQPFARCMENGPATTLVAPSGWQNIDLYTSDGIAGAHGGSGMSAIGGTIRVGEIRSSEPIRHALKVVVYMALVANRCETRSNCYVWPAYTADSYAGTTYGTKREGNSVYMKMGALLAIPQSVDINTLGLVTRAAKKLAWTLQNYGAYIVDDSAWDAYGFVWEVGPYGDARTECDSPPSGTSDMAKDIQKLFAALHVVTNNRPNSIGGPGRRLQPWAPDFMANPTLPDGSVGAQPPGFSSSVGGSSSSGISSSSAPSSSSGVAISPQGILEAESASLLQGLVNKGNALGQSNAGDFAAWFQLSFNQTYRSVVITYGVPAEYAGNKIQLRLGSATGNIIAELKTRATGGWNVFVSDTVSLSSVQQGKYDLFLVYTRDQGVNDWVADVDRIQFLQEQFSLSRLFLDFRDSWISPVLRYRLNGALWRD